MAVRDEVSGEDGFWAFPGVGAGFVAAADFADVTFFVVAAGVGFAFAAIAADDVPARGLLLALVEFVLAKPEASSGGGASSVLALAEFSFESVVFGDAPRPPRGGASLMVATSIDGRRGGLGAFTNGLGDASSAPSGEG